MSLLDKPYHESRCEGGAKIEYVAQSDIPIKMVYLDGKRAGTIYMVANESGATYYYVPRVGSKSATSREEHLSLEALYKSLEGK